MPAQLGQHRIGSIISNRRKTFFNEVKSFKGLTMRINVDDLTESREAAHDAEVPIPLTLAVKLPATPVGLELPPNSHLG